MGQSLAIKIINILFYILFALSIVLGIVFFAVTKNEEPLIMWSYALTIIAIGSAVVFAFVNIFQSKKSIFTSLIVFALFGVLVGISYGFADSIIPTNAAGELIENITETSARWSGAMLYMLYVLLGLSFISLIYTEIRSAFN